ncbi:LysR family transcriptional regulator [Pengzhenrongella sp.]|jgi:DNA-binding transcriptional LysR family regulator|uniref:LysR family transcriptional regulator n=1 Tax=Pengzhenrongella sp. TaxID=2888820 RepID=UPI002F927AEF
MIDLHRLRVLSTVVATGSVSAAAAVLGYTPSAISQQLTVLQRETGLQLVERHGRGIEPTAAGRTLAAGARGVLEAMNGIEALVGDLRAGRVGTLSISYFASAGAAWIPAVVAVLICEFPDLRLDLRLSELRAAGDSDPDLEVFVGYGGPGRPWPPVEGPPAGSTVHHLLDEPFVAVVPEAHPLAGRSRVPLRDLASEQWVDNDFNRGLCRQVVLDAAAGAGFVPDFRIETPDDASALSFVAAGVGITVLPLLGTQHLPRGVVAVPIVDPTPVRGVYLAVKAAVERHPASVRALELFRERVAGHPAAAS